MKKYLLLTVTAGEGHNSVTNAIKDKLSENPNNTVKVIDIFKSYGKPGKVALINDGYICACKYALPLYNMVYKSLEKKGPENKNFNAAQTWIDYETPQLLKDIYLYEPDVIICSHFYGGIIITNLRKKYPIPAKVVAVLTDYTVHPYWDASTGIDYLITPTDTLHERLIFKGFKPEQLIPSGIPVKKAFEEKMTKLAARKELGLEKDIFTVLVMAGGGGFGHIETLFKKLIKVKTKMQIILVNGRNESSKKHIDDMSKNIKTPHKIVSLGFVKNIPTLMSASDCIVSKCGGITTNEALNRERVMILSEKLAQQEYENMLYLTNHNAAIKLDKYNKLETVIEELVKNPNVLTKMEKEIKKISKPNALNDLCKLVDGFPKVNYAETKTLTQKDFIRIRKEIKDIKLQENAEMKKEKQALKKAEKLAEKNKNLSINLPDIQQKLPIEEKTQNNAKSISAKKTKNNISVKTAKILTPTKNEVISKLQENIELTQPKKKSKKSAS